jgi:hypothetical protein
MNRKSPDSIGSTFLDIINVDFSLITKVERALSILLAKSISFVDLGVLWEFTVCL